MPAPIALLAIIGLGLAAVELSSDKKTAAGPPFSNGMPADKGLPADTRAMVEDALQREPDPPGPGGYQVLVNAITQTSAMLQQNYPLAAAALTERWKQLRAEALQQGWRMPDAMG